VKGPPGKPPGSVGGVIVQPGAGDGGVTFLIDSVDGGTTTSGKPPAGPVVKGPPGKPPAGSVVEGSKGSPTGTNTDIVKGGGRSVFEGAIDNKANTTTDRVDKTSVSTTSTGNSGTKTGTSVSSIRGYTFGTAGDKDTGRVDASFATKPVNHSSRAARIERLAPAIPHANTEISKADVHVELNRTPAPKAPHPNVARTVHLAPVHVPTNVAPVHVPTNVAPVHVPTNVAPVHVPTPRINIKIPTIPIH